MLREWEAKTAEGDRCVIRKLNENGPNYPFVVPEIGKMSFFNDWRKMQRDSIGKLSPMNYRYWKRVFRSSCCNELHLRQTISSLKWLLISVWTAKYLSRVMGLANSWKSMGHFTGELFTSYGPWSFLWHLIQHLMVLIQSQSLMNSYPTWLQQSANPFLLCSYHHHPTLF